MRLPTAKAIINKAIAEFMQANPAPIGTFTDTAKGFITKLLQFIYAQSKIKYFC